MRLDFRSPGPSRRALLRSSTSNTTLCTLALGKTATGTNMSRAIQIGPGNGSIDFSNCSLFSNSSASTLYRLRGPAILPQLDWHRGGHSISGSGSQRSAFHRGPTVTDPFTSASVPSTSALPCVTQPAGKSINLVLAAIADLMPIKTTLRCKPAPTYWISARKYGVLCKKRHGDR